jgi:hypothetical protein
MRLCCQCQGPLGRLETIRTARLIPASVAAAVLGALALGLAAPPASAQTPCWKQILNEWTAHQDGYISPSYPLRCYSEAIGHVPEDLAQYTGVIDDILAARQQAARGVRTVQSHSGPSSTQPNPNDPDSSVYSSAIDKLGPTNSDSLPLPLLILAGLAAIMVVAGGAGLATRHLRARKTPG